MFLLYDAQSSGDRTVHSGVDANTSVFAYRERSIACGIVWITKESRLEPANMPWKVAGFHDGTPCWSQRFVVTELTELARRPCSDEAARKGGLFTIEDPAKTGHPHSFVRSTQKRMALCNQPEQREEKMYRGFVCTWDQ